jgi:hypothetical protein
MTYYGAPPAAPKRRGRAVLKFIAGLIMGLFIFFVGVLAGSATTEKPTAASFGEAVASTAPVVTTTTAAPPAKSAPAPVATTRAVPKPVTVGNGVWSVPDEIKPGTYVVTAPNDGFGCHWARLKSTDGDLDSINANGNVDSGARGRFTVKASDKAVELDGDCEWTKK